MSIERYIKRYNAIMEQISGTSHLLIRCNSELDNEYKTATMTDEQLAVLMADQMEWQQYRITEPTMLMNEMIEQDKKLWWSIVGKVSRFISSIRKAY